MVKSFANNSRRFSTARLLVLLLLLSCHCQAEEYEYEEEEEEYEEEHPPEFYAAEDVFSSWHIWDIYWWLECKVDHHSDANPDALPVHSAAAWQLLRQAYRETVGETESSLPPEEEDIDDDGRAARDGFQVPVQVVKMPERGRGNYVTEMVPEGTLVWSSKYTAQFTTAEQYRSFLRRLPPALACDVIVWAYTRWTTPDDTNAVACVDLDIGSFTNMADTDAEWNMDLGIHGDDNHQKTFHNTGCKLEFYAVRDIPKGEELAIDYDFSARGWGWHELGLLPYAFEAQKADYEDGETPEDYLWPEADAYDEDEDEENEL